MSVAADVFSIRYVCGFGANLPDGVVSFDDLLTADKLDPAPIERRAAGPMPQPISRRSPSMRAKAASCRSRAVMPNCWRRACVLLESGIAQDAVIQSTLGSSSFAGCALRWCRGSCAAARLCCIIHSIADALADRWRDEQCPTLILPDAVAFPAGRKRAVRARLKPASIIAAWRAPERLATSPTWRASGSR